MEHNQCLQRWENMQKIFISYSRKDIDFARKLAGDLESAGYDVWWDISDLKGGDDWVRTIPDAIASSQYVIVVLTPNSIESEWVRKEYTQALSLRKKIIPIMFTPCSVPFSLNTINFVNFTTGEYADNFKKLLSPLGYTGAPPIVSPYKKALLSIPYLKYGIPAAIGLILLLAFIFIPKNNPPAAPTVTPTPIFESSPTASATPEPPTATPSPTVTVTASITFTPTSTRTASPTVFYKVSLPMCIIADSTNIRVRSGPSGTYGYILLDLEDASGQRINVCPDFSAKIDNEGYTWLLIAPNQEDRTLQPFEGKWIRRDLLENIAIDILPVVTLTATPTPSDTPTTTATFTRTPMPTNTSTPTITPSPTATNTFTPTPTDTFTPTATDTDPPTETPAS
jgi:hypothetical protein